MRTRTFALVFGLCLLAVACYGSDPSMGTWKLNEAKSKVAKGSPKNQTVVYEASGDSVKVTTDGTDAQGQPAHTEWTGKFDGQDYPVSGTSIEDARAVKKINDHTFTISLKKDGKEVGTGHIVIAPDGKSRTVTITRIGPDGKRVTTKSVYDKR
jgi:hypothetical protein